MLTAPAGIEDRFSSCRYQPKEACYRYTSNLTVSPLGHPSCMTLYTSMGFLSVSIEQTHIYLIQFCPEGIQFHFGLPKTLLQWTVIVYSMLVVSNLLCNNESLWSVTPYNAPVT